MTSTKTLNKIHRFLICTLMIQTFVLSSAEAQSSQSMWSRERDYQELTYEDLVNELNEKKSKVEIQNQKTTTGGMRVLSLGLVNTQSNIRINNSDQVRALDGFHLAYGKELSTQNTILEGLYRHFQNDFSGSERRSAYEASARLIQKNPLSVNTGTRLGGSLGLRHVNIRDRKNNVSVYETTPHLGALLGFEVFASRFTSLSLEAQARIALDAASEDKSGLDLTLRMDSFF